MITVVVPTHERCALVEQLLRALDVQTLAPERFEVVVIVDGSTDGTSDLLARFHPSYSLTWRWQEHAGRATACNAGIALARGDLIVLLDDDMEPTAGLLAAHAAAHVSGSRRAVMGAAPVVTPPGSDAVVRYIARRFNGRLDTLASQRRPFILRDFYSGNVSIPRELLEEVGGFDEDFTVYGNEDLELWCRLRAAGVELVFSEAALAHQHYVKDFRALARDNVEKGNTVVLLASKHPAIVDELKLTAIERGRTRRRVLLNSLVQLTRCCPATFDHVVRVMSAVARLDSPALDRAYGLAADYCYLLGAAAARDRQAKGAVQ